MLKLKLRVRNRIVSVDFVEKEIKKVNHKITECSKRAQKESKIRHDSGGKDYPIGIVLEIKI